MSLPVYKTNPARPTVTERTANGDISQWGDQGLTQYAEVAARFHAGILSSEWGHQERSNPAYAAQRSFDHADAFFAELAERMTT